MNKITISDIDNSIDDIYNTQINITNVKLYIDSAIITDLFNDIPNTLVPLFVQKVLSNVYQLQGKETPLTIKRRIKELE